MLHTVCMILSVLLSALCVYSGVTLLKRREKYGNGLEKFKDKSIFYKAAVLDTAVMPVDSERIKAVIVQFRDEKQHKTIVHRYTGSGGKKYLRGDEVRLYYCEESDTACIEGDNPFYLKMKRSLALAVMLFVMSGVFAALFLLLLIY